MDKKELVKRALAEKENRAYRKRREKLQTSYGEWIADLERQQAEDLGPGGAGSGFVLVCASQGGISRDAIKHIDRYFFRHREAQLLYGDEDVWPGYGGGADGAERLREKGLRVNERSHPWFKPDWSPDLLDSCLYFGSVVALRKELCDKVLDLYRSRGCDEGLRLLREAQGKGAGREAADLAFYEKLVHDCAELAGAYQRGSRAVGHVPAVLFHSESVKEQEKFLMETSRVRQRWEGDLADFRSGMAAREAESVEKDPVVSVVVPSKDHPDILEKCLRSCLAAASAGEGKDLPLEVLLVDNGSSEVNRGRVEMLVRELSAPGFRVRYLYRPMEFHFSRMCNLGAESAKGRFLLFLNDDVEFCLPGCIEKMAALAARPYTGAVGVKLLYPDSYRIQHAGITNLPMGPVHKLQFLDDNDCYYYNFNRGRRNFLAVTGACLMTEKDKFREAGGFSEKLRVAFNDVDLGFRLYESGYFNVCMNDLYAYHCESLSRGDDESPEKLERLVGERDRLYDMHPGLQGADPFYSQYLNRDGLDARVRPAFLTAGNRLQEIVGPAAGSGARRLKRPGGNARPFLSDLRGFRRDECLLVRVEECRHGVIRGYSVVLGDNNACYKKWLLLEKQSGERYLVSTAEQYRPDLEENMPDQVNVGLCGFAVKLAPGALPPGHYRLGAAAVNRTGGLRLINLSSRSWHVGAENENGSDGRVRTDSDSGKA